MTSQKITEAQLSAFLQSQQVPQSRIAGLHISAEGGVTLALQINPDEAKAIEGFRQSLEKGIAALDGVSKAQVILTADRPPAAASEKPAQKPIAPEVKRIIAVASGKGGVGKSTVAANLAISAAAAGLRVGLLDADIYGPSQPLLMGLPATPPPLDDEKRMIPPIAHGVKVMSIGLMVDSRQALVWRGPMIQTALQQMLRDVAWGDLDVLFVDMPPGTGDIQISIAQTGRLFGAIIVSTPQDLALADARRGVAMFQKVDVPILGLIENMSHYCCPACGHKDFIFGQQGVAEEAAALGVPLLGEIPLSLEVRAHEEKGAPVAASLPTSHSAEAFRLIIGRLAQIVTKG